LSASQPLTNSLYRKLVDNEAIASYFMELLLCFIKRIRQIIFRFSEHCTRSSKGLWKPNSSSNEGDFSPMEAKLLKMAKEVEKRSVDIVKVMQYG
jgi:hypothetical protein